MIHSISANQGSFQTVRFEPGLNVVLADRTEESSRKDTRNGLGKSTLIEIIHFCLGARAQKGRGLIIESLQDWVFTMDLTLAGTRISVTRAIANPNVVTVTGLAASYPGIPAASLLGDYSFSQKQWMTFLGRTLFSLPEPAAPKYNPSFRSLISYFVRRGHHAFGDPFTHARQQQRWDSQLHVALLLGLEWRHAAESRRIQDRQNKLRQLRKLADDGDLPYVAGTIGELEAERVTLEQDIEREARALDDFRVHPQYEAIQQEADRVTAKLHSAANARVVATRRLKMYQQAIASEQPPTGEAVERVYQEMGIVFSESVLRTLGEAREFYGLVVKDRQRFLQTEVSRLEDRVSVLGREVEDLTEARADLLDILGTHGALDEMRRLQDRHTARLHDLERVKTLIEHRRQVDEEERRINRQKTDLADLAANDYRERRDTWSVPVRLFNLNSRALYRASGHLAIDTTDSGFRFSIDIARSGSEGIGKMKVFCFDLALLEFSARRGLGTDFLIHDSELYDGVDSRQRAAAIQRAHDIANATDTQYICALNSDMVPYDDFTKGFDFDQHVRLKLTDREPAGTLLGMVFDPPTGA